MQAGKFDKEVRIQRPTVTRDGVGQQTTDQWTTVALVWANIRPLKTELRLLAAQTRQSTTHEITLYQTSEIADMDTTWRLLRDGDIVYVLDGPPIDVDGRGREFRLMVTEGLRER